ncbi:alpha/beta fold hydrolase [Nocardioides alcanivorans]|uniref:alpha/beta fold hydrolase n=1 Tax=Nocardioides alcanivorans TaxID=2897352 RepID=UPI001F1F95EA|nr:alpha/beta fold hydrolase [Nocardioides alcanivorans]
MDRITTFTNAGFTFDVRDSGPVDGDPVVLLHGFPQRATSWDKVAAHLHEAGLRTLAPDQRGYSPGARPKGRRPYRVPELVGDVVALIDRVGRPVHLVGHDWGAVVAWSLAAERPDLVRTLTAVSVPHPAAFIASMARSTQALKSWYMLLFNLPGVVEQVAKRKPELLEGSLRRAGMTREMVAVFRQEMVADGALPGGLGWYRALPLTDPRLGAATVSVPTTMVWSTGDVALGRKGAELTADHVTGPYRLEVLEGASHWLPDEEPARLARAVLERIAEAAG